MSNDGSESIAMHSRARGRFPRARRSLAILALVTAAVEAPVHSAAATESSSNEARYREAIDQAIAAFEAADLKGARAAFERAHALSPSARTLRGIGITAFEQGDYPVAASSLRAALDETRKPLSGEQRTEVTTLLAKAEEHVGRVTVRTVPEGATVRMDGFVVESGQELEVAKGAHAFRADLQGYAPASREPYVPAGESTTVTLELHPVEKPPSRWSRGSPGESKVKSVTPSPPPEQHGRLWTWVALSAAPMFAGVSAGIWLSGLSEAQQIKNCNCSEAERTRRADAAALPAKETWTTITAVAAGAALGGAVVLYFVEGAADRSRQGSLGVGIAGSSVFLRGTL